MRLTPALAALIGAAFAFLAEALVAPAGARSEECRAPEAKSDLSAAEAQALFDCVSGTLYSGYQASGLPEAAAYRDWALASTAPFVSATHGSRFVNHYINAVGEAAYLDYLDGGFRMPVGSIAAKESFNVDRTGAVKPGPLFFMEKLARGASPETADWKYTLILPNGKVLGVTGTETGDKVGFCHDCHEAVADTQDALFYPVEAYRVSR